MHSCLSLATSSTIRPKKKNMCVYYLMKISNRVGRSIFFFIFLFYLILNRVGRVGQVDFFSIDFFSIDFFSLFMYQGLEGKK